MRANILDANAVRVVPARHLFSAIVGHFVVACCSFGAVGCGHKKTAAPPVAAVPVVEVVAPIKQALKRTILQPGYARPYEQTPIYSRVPGYVAEVPVDIGDQVEKGQLLAKLWVPELKAELDAKTARVGQAEAQINQAGAALDAAKANVAATKANAQEALAAIARGEAEYERWNAELERGKKLATGLVYDKQTLDEVLFQKKAARAGWNQAKAKHQSAEASIVESEAKEKKASADLAAAKESELVAKADRDQAKVWYDYREIRAPYAGVIALRNVHTGHFLQVSSSGSTNKSAEPIFNMVRTDKLRITVQVPEYDAPLVKAGEKAIVTFQGLKDEQIVGKVTRMSDVLDNESRTLRVEIHLPNQDGKLRPGMYVNAAIEVETPKVWTLPNDAVFTDGEKTYCFIVDSRTSLAMKTALQIGVKNDLLVEVMKKQARSPQDKDRQGWEDITGSEQVVAANPESLIDNQEVKIAAPKNAPTGKE